MRSYSFAIQFTIPECPHLLSFVDTGNVNLHIRNTPPPLFLSSNNEKYTSPRPDQINLRGHKERSVTPFLVSFITNSVNRIFGISGIPPPLFFYYLLSRPLVVMPTNFTICDFHRKPKLINHQSSAHKCHLDINTISTLLCKRNPTPSFSVLLPSTLQNNIQ